MDRSVIARDPFIAARVCASKATTAKWLRQAGLPAPVHRLVNGLPAALKVAAEIGWPVVVKPIDGERGEDEEVTALIHPDNLKAALMATELFGLDMAGIDIISTDISRPWFETGAVINEVNFAPLLGGAEISRRRHLHGQRHRSHHRNQIGTGHR